MRWIEVLAPLRSRSTLDDAGLAPEADVDRSPAKGVVASIARHELRRLAASIRLRSVSLLLLVLLVLPALTGSARYRSELAAQAETVELYDAALAAATLDDLAELRHPALRPPWRQSWVVDGGQSATPNVYEQALSPLVAPVLRRAQRGNHRLPGPATLDWMFAIGVALSIAAFLLGHDAICGERQRGTLRLLLSQPIARWKILAGKLAALWLCLAVPLIVGSGISCALAAALGTVPLRGADLAAAGSVLLLGLWAAVLFVLVALAVSAASKLPSTSLSVLALLWVGAVVGVPALGNLLAHRLAPVPGEAELERRTAWIQQRIAERHAGREGRWRAPAWAAADGYAWEQASARAENERRRLAERIEQESLGAKLRQARLARTLSCLSPALLVHDLGERLTGTGLARDAAYLAQARAFRPSLEEHVRRIDAADPQSPHVLFFRGYLSSRAVDPEAVPRFVFRELSAAESLTRSAPRLAVLGLETVLLAALAWLLFARLEPR
jgi:ABC-type transport system involved in multi-copper enzyme maturation permease subunit